MAALFRESVSQKQSRYQLGCEARRLTDEVGASDGRVVGSAAGNADFGVVGPLVEEVVRTAMGVGIGTSEEGRGHKG